jgi:serine/threonine protein kinase
MEYLSGMVPLTNLSSAPSTGTTAWYLSTGSLRRRLEILARVANSLRQLHSRGLVYGDPSPSNVFVSEDPKFTEVWLIDCDNLCYTSSPAQTLFFTPRYGAPELVRGKSGFNTLTDAHAFAVMAFEVLTLVHPLIGAAVTDGPPERELAALRGELLWICAPGENTNKSEFGITPRAHVLSAKLFGIFRETFEQGLADASRRPGLEDWQRVLSWAAFATVACPSCAGSFYRSNKSCPWCGSAVTPYLSATLIDVLPELKQAKTEIAGEFNISPDTLPQSHAEAFGQVTIAEGEGRVVTDFHLNGGSPRHERFTLDFSKSGIRIENHDTPRMYVLQEQKWLRLREGADARVRLPKAGSTIAIRIGDFATRHIAMKFAVTGAPT